MIPEFEINSIPSSKAGLVENVYSLLLKSLQNGKSLFFPHEGKIINNPSFFSMPAQSLLPKRR